MYKWSIAGLLLAATLVACPAITGTVTGIDLTAAATILNTNATTNLTATVSGTGAFSKAVTWSKVGGGTINFVATGVTFTAPSTASSTQITAASTQDPSQSKTITITTNAINPGSTVTSVTITPPASSTLNANVAINLVAVLVGTGSPNTAVNWSKVSGGGTLSSQAATSVTFTAPATASSTVIRATSVQDSSKFGEITLTTIVDSAAPKISVTNSINNTTVHVTFDEAILATSVVTAQFKVGLPLDLTVTNAVLSATDPKIVILTTAPQVKDASYVVLVNNVSAATKVTDLAGNQHQPGDGVTSSSSTFIGK